MSQFESQFEEDLYAARLEKLERIADLGAATAGSHMEAKYPNHFRFSTDIPSIRQQFETLTHDELEAQKPPVAIAGRLVAIRLQGKAGFATLQQGGQRLQIYVRKDNVGDDAFELYRLLDLGDHIGVEGTLFRTRTNELTVQAAKLTFLAKALLPLPDKYSGLGDIELRYRRRYLDLFTDTGDFAEPSPNPASSPMPSPASSPASNPASEPASSTIPDPALLGTGFSPSITAALEAGALAPEGISTPTQTRLPAREVFVKRAAILRSIRNFFDTRGYLEVETPMLHTVAGGAAARPFTTHHNALDIPLSLRIAPELYLKRLVVGGLDRVYEINRNFRNEGVSTSHNPEFTMLEFYQAYANYEQLMTLTQDLITTVAKEVNGTTITSFNGNMIDLSNWRKLSMRQAIIDRWPEYYENMTPRMEDLSSREGLVTLLGRLRVRSEQMASDISEKDPTNALLPAAQGFPLYIDKVLSELGEGNQYGKAVTFLFEAFVETRLIQPHIIYDFPLAVSPLSKIKPDEPDWVERFEFYIGGFEVGNAFSELNDPVDQRNRFAAQVEDKDPESMAAIDEDYVRALGYGLPPTAGEGIGIDRLTMILTGSRSIRDVILFPLMRPRTETPDSSTS